MKRIQWLFVLIGLALFGYSCPCRAIAADDGAKVYTDACSSCHTAKLRPLDNSHLTKEQWKDAIDRMIDEGVEVPKGKMAELLDYLSRTHGPGSAATAAGKK
jgi:mono/diheme cytochrome c family protein